MSSGHYAMNPISLRFLLAFALLAALPSCLSSNTDTGAGTGKSTLFLEDMNWGRLVDVLDGTGSLVEADVVIRESLQSDGINYRLSQNVLTQKDILTILHLKGSAAFEQALADAQTGLASLQIKGFASPPPFTKVARNGAVRMEFSEFLDPDTVDRQTIQVLVDIGGGSFQNLEVRYVVKEAVGADGKARGVVIIDPTVSRFDAAELGIPENGVGFPESFDQIGSNIKIRIPTQLNPFLNQTLILTNKAGSQTFDVRRNGSGTAIQEPFEQAGFDPVSVRAFRSGNEDDPYKGFMTDNVKPSLIVSQDVTISQIQALGASVRTLVYSMDAVRCRGLTPKAGDVFEIDDAVLQVTQVVSASNPSAYEVEATLLAGELAAGSGSVAGALTTRYTSADQALQLCYVKFSPEAGELPAVGVDPYSSLSVRFSEPVDGRTIRSLDSMVLASVDLDAPAPGPGEDPDPARAWNAFGSGETVSDYIDRLPGFDLEGGSGRIQFGPISVAGDSRTFTLTPLAGMTDALGEGPGLFPSGMFLNLALRDGPDGIFDLAGNQVDFSGFVAGDPNQSEYLTLGGQPSSWPTDKYFALRGNGQDENGDQLPEYGGQLGQAQGDGVLRGRALQRFSRAADPTNQYVGQRLLFGQGLMTPLTPAGAVLMTLYAPHHLGFGVTNPSEFNLTVEGLSWSPFDGVIFDTVFSRYSVALAHSNRVPDDYIDPGSGYPSYPESGLRRLSSQNFDQNIFAFSDDPVEYAEFDEKVVFDSSYQVSDINKYTNAGGYFMYPWPDFSQTYLWRDTSMPVADGSTVFGGAPLGQALGAPPRVVQTQPVYQTTKVPSVALPLLMRYRCYPLGAEFGFNGFQVQIMVGSSALPAFRVFSSGGRDGQGNWNLVRPDLPPEGTAPTGGYNTSSGLTTKGYGPELYWGQVDFVIAVSRVYTHWFDFGGDLAALSNLTLEPTPQQANPGTEVVVEFRSSEVVSIANCTASDPTPLNDAGSNFDAFGNYVETTGCGTVSTPIDWTEDPDDLVAEGHRYFQMRFTFVSNSEQDLEAELDAFGFAWTNLP